MKSIKAGPKRSVNEIVVEIVVVLFAALFFGAAIGSALIWVHSGLSTTMLNQTQRYLYVTIGTVISLIGTMVFLRNNRKKFYWELDENYLIRGDKDKVRFRLEDIEKIIIGIPAWGGTVGKISRFASPAAAENLNVAFRSALIIKLNSNAFIPLNIHSAEHGTELMNALLERLRDRIDERYEFNTRERRLLQMPKWNSVTTLNT